MVIAPIKH